MKGIQAHLDVDSTAQPKFHKPCPAPYSLRTPIEQDLKCLEESGVREMVTHSDWAAPIVPVPKPDGFCAYLWELQGDYESSVEG